MVGLRPFLDAPIPPGSSTDFLLQPSDDRSSATFVEDLDNGNAVIHYPVDSTNRVVAPRESGLYSVGAICPVLLGSEGRVTRIFPPEILDDEEVLGFGATGERILRNIVDAGEIRDELEASQGRIDAAVSETLSVREAAAEAHAAAMDAQSEADRAMSTADSKNKIYYQIGTPPPDVLKKGDRWYSSSTGEAQVWTGTAWRDTTPGEGFVPALDIGKATVGDMQVGRLTGEASQWKSSAIETLISDNAFAKNLWSEKIVVATDNMIPNPAMDKKEFWSNSAQLQPTGGKNGGGSLLLPQASTQQGAYVANSVAELPFATEVTRGASYRVGAWCQFSTSGVTDGASIYAKWWNPSTNAWEQATKVATSTATAANTWVWLSGSIIAPDNATHVSVGFFRQASQTAGTVRWSDPLMRPMVDGVLISKGAVDANAVNAQSVAGAVGSFLKIRADQIEANSFKGHSIDGARITGGVFGTALTNARLQIAGSDTYPSMRLYDKANKEIGSFGLVDATQTAQWYPQLIMRNEKQAARFQIGPKAGGTGFIMIWRDENSAPRLLIDDSQTGGIRFQTPTYANNAFNTTLGPGKLALDQGAGGSAGGLWVTNISTTTASSNVVIGGDGRFAKNGSTRAIKAQIRNVTVDARRILDLSVRDWYDRGEALQRAEIIERNANREAAGQLDQLENVPVLRRIPGVIAEEVEELGLELFNTYETDGELQGVMYDRLPLLLIPVVKSQEEKIAALEAENLSLTGTLAALTARVEALETK